MRVDASLSEYHEANDAEQEFSRTELRLGRVLLRRLRFLEAQIREQGGLRNGNASGGGLHAEMELDALEWALHEIGFLADTKG